MTNYIWQPKILVVVHSLMSSAYTNIGPVTGIISILAFSHPNNSCNVSLRHKDHTLCCKTLIFARNARLGRGQVVVVQRTIYTKGSDVVMINI